MGRKRISLEDHKMEEQVVLTPKESEIISKIRDINRRRARVAETIDGLEAEIQEIIKRKDGLYADKQTLNREGAGLLRELNKELWK